MSHRNYKVPIVIGFTLAAVVTLVSWTPVEKAGPSLPTLGPAPSQYALGPEEFVSAARKGDENGVRKALELNPALLNSVGTMGLTALDWAVTREHWPIVRQLLAAGANVSVVGFDGGTALHRLAHHNQPELAHLLLEAGADPNLQNQWGRTPLHVAARRGQVDVAEVLFAGGASLDTPTKEGWTPLHVAYRAGQPGMVEWLVAVGANEGTADEEGRAPVDHRFQRPPRWEGNNPDLWEYQGHYRVNEEFVFTVRVENGLLTLRDFSVEPLYPTGPDAFFAEAEPWSVRFSRDAEGTITAIEVAFLRRTESGTRIDYPEYVGSHKCGECHATGENGSPYVPWLRSRHASAYWRLATDWSQILTRQRPHFRDLTDPISDSRCLNCHTTAPLDEYALFSESFRVEEGIGCEACHGPGSSHVDTGSTGDRRASPESGLRIPDETTCQGCHRNPDTFSFQEWWPRIQHGSRGNR